jgi:hypothetical protein
LLFEFNLYRCMLVERKEEAKRKLSEARAGADSADKIAETKSEEIADAVGL